MNQIRLLVLAEGFNPSDWTVERSSGFLGMRNIKTGEWLLQADYQQLESYVENAENY